MPKVRDVIEVMEQWTPSSLAESWDNVGLITGNPEDNIESILLTLDTTERRIETAAKNRALIITHHPPIFKPLKTLAGSSPGARIIRRSVREDVPIFAAHTNLDQAPDGVGSALARKLGLSKTAFLAPGKSGTVKFVIFVPPEYTDRVREAAGSAGAGIIGEYSLCSFTSRGVGTYVPSQGASPFEGKSGKLSRVEEDKLEMLVPEPYISDVIRAVRGVHPYEEPAYDVIRLSGTDSPFGYGAVGELPEPMEPERFAAHVAEVLGTKSLKVSPGCGKTVRRVAVMGGSGGGYIGHAVGSGADAFVTGDLGYHDFCDFGESILLIDATHHATELPVLERIRERLSAAEALQPLNFIVAREEQSIPFETKIYI